MKPATKRGLALGGLLVIMGCGLGLVLKGLNESIVFYVTPSEITPAHCSQKIRLGGLVQQGSIKQDPQTGVWQFSVHDATDAIVPVQFQGLPPALFQEEKGIVAEGSFYNKNFFQAERLLAKHDETYTPPATSSAEAQSKTPASMRRAHESH